MKVRWSKGACPNPAHREACVVSREAGDEALTAARAGGVMEYRKRLLRSAEAGLSVGGNIRRSEVTLGRKAGRGSAVSKNSSPHVRPESGPGRSAGRSGRSPPGPWREGLGSPAEDARRAAPAQESNHRARVPAEMLEGSVRADEGSGERLHGPHAETGERVTGG